MRNQKHKDSKSPKKTKITKIENQQSPEDGAGALLGKRMKGKFIPAKEDGPFLESINADSNKRLKTEPVFDDKSFTRLLKEKKQSTNGKDLSKNFYKQIREVCENLEGRGYENSGNSAPDSVENMAKVYFLVLNNFGRPKTQTSQFSNLGQKDQKEMNMNSLSLTSASLAIESWNFTIVETDQILKILAFIVKNSKREDLIQNCLYLIKKIWNCSCVSLPKIFFNQNFFRCLIRLGASNKIATAAKALDLVDLCVDSGEIVVDHLNYFRETFKLFSDQEKPKSTISRYIHTLVAILNEFHPMMKERDLISTVAAIFKNSENINIQQKKVLPVLHKQVCKWIINTLTVDNCSEFLKNIKKSTYGLCQFIPLSSNTLLSQDQSHHQRQPLADLIGGQQRRFNLFADQEISKFCFEHFEEFMSISSRNYELIFVKLIRYNKLRIFGFLGESIAMNILSEIYRNLRIMITFRRSSSSRYERNDVYCEETEMLKSTKEALELVYGSPGKGFDRFLVQGDVIVLLEAKLRLFRPFAQVVGNESNKMEIEEFHRSHVKTSQKDMRKDLVMQKRSKKHNFQQEMVLLETPNSTFNILRMSSSMASHTFKTPPLSSITRSTPLNTSSNYFLFLRKLQLLYSPAQLNGSLGFDLLKSTTQSIKNGSVWTQSDHTNFVEALNPQLKPIFRPRASLQKNWINLLYLTTDKTQWNPRGQNIYVFSQEKTTVPGFYPFMIRIYSTNLKLTKKVVCTNIVGIFGQKDLLSIYNRPFFVDIKVMKVTRTSTPLILLARQRTLVCVDLQGREYLHKLNFEKKMNFLSCYKDLIFAVTEDELNVCFYHDQEMHLMRRVPLFGVVRGIWPVGGDQWVFVVFKHIEGVLLVNVGARALKKGGYTFLRLSLCEEGDDDFCCDLQPWSLDYAGFDQERKILVLATLDDLFVVKVGDLMLDLAK